MVITQNILPVISNTKIHRDLQFVPQVDQGGYFWSIMNMLSFNKPTLDLYLELQMNVIGLTLLNIHLWFDSLPNAMAEVTMYGDRQFYVDWWNAETIEEFIQKWFKLPYIFFYRHCFVTLVIKYGLNR